MAEEERIVEKAVKKYAGEKKEHILRTRIYRLADIYEVRTIERSEKSK